MHFEVEFRMIKMIIKKITELHFKKNDIYILENHNDTIIVNNNNQGLLLFNTSLHIQKELSVAQEAPIYYLYKKHDNNALMLYLPDINQIILVDLEEANTTTINLPKSFDTEVLSPNYYWSNDACILLTNNNTFYQLDSASKTLLEVSNHIIQKNCPSFFTFWTICKQYDILTFYP